MSYYDFHNQYANKIIMATWKCGPQFSKSPVPLHPAADLPFFPNRPLALHSLLWSCADGWHLRNIAFGHFSSSFSLSVNLSLSLFSSLLILISHFSLSLICRPFLQPFCDLQFHSGNIFCPPSFSSPLFLSLSLSYISVEPWVEWKQTERGSGVEPTTSSGKEPGKFPVNSTSSPWRLR